MVTPRNKKKPTKSFSQTLHKVAGNRLHLKARVRTVEQKQQPVDDSESYLDRFQQETTNFLHRYVTIDETWIRHYTSESNRQSARPQPANLTKSPTERNFVYRPP